MSEITLHETQIKAIDFAVENTFAIINGGAGTGKTTIIKEIAERVASPLLCAFAGKAAARLREATGIEASTIHRALEFRETHFALETLKGKSVIVDEASMVSTDLMAEIMKRKPDRLVLVGDEAQLPPVGKGQPFHDILAMMPERSVKLTKCFRNKEAVFKAAMAIREGGHPSASEQSEQETWQIERSGDDAQTQRKILDYVAAGNVDFEQDIILCPRNGDNDDQPCTVKGLNRAIVDIVNPRNDESVKFLPGDRVINTKNYSDKDVWNGTTGTIHAIDQSGEIWVRVDTPVIDWAKTESSKDPVYTDKVLFDKDMKKTLQLAYALTVHKSQGSQYRKVIFCALMRDAHMLLDRSLIYTAVTRTKEHCIVAGQVQALARGIANTRTKRTVFQELAKEVAK